MLKRPSGQLVSDAEEQPGKQARGSHPQVEDWDRLSPDEQGKLLKDTALCLPLLRNVNKALFEMHVYSLI